MRTSAFAAAPDDADDERVTSSPTTVPASERATDPAERRESALAPEHELEGLRAELAQRKEQLATLPEIEQAKGILMHNFNLSPDDAFALLRRLSQDSNVKLHTVAERVVSTLTGHVSAQAAHRVAGVLEEFRAGRNLQRMQDATCGTGTGGTAGSRAGKVRG